MAARLETRTTELGDSRVRVDVRVPSEAVERELEKAAGAVGRDIKIPGFRKGKVPPQVVLQRLGRAPVFEEALRQALPRWYEQAVGASGVAAVGSPKLDLGQLPERGQPLEFSLEVAVRPKARLNDYRGIEVGRREPSVSAEEIDAELERLRESVAALENVDRPARTGDFVVVDFIGSVDGEPFEGGEARGQLLELGSGRLIEGFEEQLVGARAADGREIRVTFPADYGAEHLAGKEAVFDTTVREVKEKRLPELDDDFAGEAGGFDTLDELREDIAARLREADERTIDREFREAVVDAAAAAASIDLPKELVHAKAHEMWESTARRLRAQGIDPQRYLELTGKTEEGLVEEAEDDARRSLARESVLAAVVEAEGIGVSDEEVVTALRDASAGAGPGREPSEKELRKSLERAKAEGRDAALREDIAMRKAVDVLVGSSQPLSVEQAQARDRLWTPEKERREEAGQLWTPGS